MAVYGEVAFGLDTEKVLMLNIKRISILLNKVYFISRLYGKFFISFSLENASSHFAIACLLTPILSATSSWDRFYDIFLV